MKDANIWMMLRCKGGFFWVCWYTYPGKGSGVVDSRYISEDVPQGLVLFETLGLKLETVTPVCISLIYIASAALGRNLRSEGRTMERLGENMLERIMQDRRRNHSHRRTAGSLIVF